MGLLSGRSALVTGGSRGIGRAIVERLARDGAVVTFSFVQAGGMADEVVAGVAAAGGSAQAVRCDLADGAGIVGLFEAAAELGGGLDIVVNNAAVGRVGSIIETTDAEYDEVMDVNLKGAFRVLREAARRVRDGGRIVNISTLNTIRPGPGMALYAASKGAVEQLSAVAAHELGGRGITVNVVSPGATDTDMLRGVNDEKSLAMLPRLTPLGRLGAPADIADVVAFLAGPDSAWMTGQNLRATGGLG